MQNSLCDQYPDFYDPIGIVGVFFKDTVEDIFGSGLLIVGCMLLLTAALLAFSYYAKPRQKEVSR